MNTQTCILLFCIAITPTLRGDCLVPGFGDPMVLAGDGGFSLATGDFNGDAKPDLVTVGPAVSVMLNKGDGTFPNATNYRVGDDRFTDLRSVAVGDFNGDGKADLVVANQGCPNCSPPLSGYGSVLLGNGDGTFRPAVNYPAGAAPWSVAVADFNRDSKSDFVMANVGTYDQATQNYVNDSISLFLSKGDGTFGIPINYEAGESPQCIAVGDLDNDGNADLAVSSQEGASVFLGKGDGAFQPRAKSAVGDHQLRHFLVLGDFDRDARLDIVLHRLNGVSMLLGNGDGTFRIAGQYSVDRSPTPYPVVVIPVAAAAADINGDGKLDLAVATATCCDPGPGVAIILGNGDGSFQPAKHYASGRDYFGLVVADLNGDGNLDLACAHPPVVLMNGPALSIAGATKTLTISWPVRSPGFVLESTTVLCPANWQTAAEVPTISGACWQIRVPTQASSYFRLRRP